MDPISEILNFIRPLGEVGAGALLALTVVMILTGRLVPKSVADAWRDAYFKSQEAHAVKDRTISDLADAGIVSARVMDALPHPDGGESDVATTTETRRRRRQV